MVTFYDPVVKQRFESLGIPEIKGPTFNGVVFVWALALTISIVACVLFGGICQLSVVDTYGTMHEPPLMIHVLDIQID